MDKYECMEKTSRSDVVLRLTDATKIRDDITDCGYCDSGSGLHFIFCLFELIWSSYAERGFMCMNACAEKTSRSDGRFETINSGTP